MSVDVYSEAQLSDSDSSPVSSVCPIEVPVRRSSRRRSPEDLCRIVGIRVVGHHEAHRRSLADGDPAGGRFADGRAASAARAQRSS